MCRERAYNSNSTGKYWNSDCDEGLWSIFFFFSLPTSSKLCSQLYECMATVCQKEVNRQKSCTSSRYLVLQRDRLPRIGTISRQHFVMPLQKTMLPIHCKALYILVGNTVPKPFLYIRPPYTWANKMRLGTREISKRCRVAVVDLDLLLPPWLTSSGLRICFW